MMSETSEILAAVAKAMGAVHKVKKTGQNTHDNYAFASVDDFLAMVNPICAEAGLMVAMDETGLEDFVRKGKYGENAWMRVSYCITVFHASGQSLPPVKRTVEVLRNGSQAYGSAQSYVLKQFLRCLLLIPTGDKDDADLQPTDAGLIHDNRILSAEQFIALRDLLEQAGADEAKFTAFFKIGSLEELPVAKFDAAQAMLRRKIADNATPETVDA
jgi:heme exporter protein D